MLVEKVADSICTHNIGSRTRTVQFTVLHRQCRLLHDRVERKQTLCSNTLLYDRAALTVRQIMHSDTESTLLHDSRGIRVRVRTHGQGVSSNTRLLAANWTTRNFFPPRRCNITTNAGNTCRNKQDPTNRMDPSWT